MARTRAERLRRAMAAKRRRWEARWERLLVRVRPADLEAFRALRAVTGEAVATWARFALREACWADLTRRGVGVRVRPGAPVYRPGVDGGPEGAPVGACSGPERAWVVAFGLGPWGGSRWVLVDVGPGVDGGGGSWRGVLVREADVVGVGGPVLGDREGAASKRRDVRRREVPVVGRRGDREA